MAPPRIRKPRMVGVDVQDNEDNRPLIEAMEQDNPQANVLRMPGLVKIQTEGALTIKRETVESILCRDWDTNEFQLAIISMSGNVSEWDEDEIVISWAH